MTEEIGRVLGSRYRIIQAIGRGASAQVFLADDTRLRRRVAVKMLHPALADDAEFLRRFQAEAHAVAQLNHPHVMAVYDWGQDGEIPYLVTEFLAGGSLRAMLDRGARLSLPQVLKVGLEATRALEYAESRGLVHRDIKPANLLFGDEGRLRIADFGLARALAEAAWTEPQGAVLGTARYSSPEQAQGAWLTAKADVYSLALVMVEAVTGEVPFTADTTIGTLMARIGKPLPVPEEMGALRSIIERAGRADAAERLDAHRLSVALMALADSLGPAEPLPLAGATDHDLLVTPEIDRTMHAGTRLHSAGTRPSAVFTPVGEDAGDTGDATGLIDLTDRPGAGRVPLPVFWAPGEPIPVDEIEDRAGAPAAPEAPGAPGAPGAPTDPAEEGPRRPSRRDQRRARREARTAEQSRADPSGASPATAEDGDGGSGDPADEAPDRRRRWPRAAAIVLAVLALVAGAVAATQRSGEPDDSAPPVAAVTHPVPDLVGDSEEAAGMRAAANDWELDITRTRQDDTVPGEVLEVDPEPGTELAEGETLRLTVSDGTKPRTVPDLAGKTQEQAEAILGVLKLTPKVTEAYDELVAQGVVIGVAEGTPDVVHQNDPVEMIVSRGPEPRTVPSGQVGYSVSRAEEELAALGLRVEVERVFSDEYDAGLVVDVPAEGTAVPRDSAVRVLVSKGPNLITVPDVSGADSLDEAVAMLRNAGAGVGGVSGPAVGSPVGTDPPAGTELRRGASVGIILG